MSSYILTDADIELLSNFAGTLNAGRVLVPAAARFGNIGIPAAPDSSPTQNPSIKWSHADEITLLVARIKGTLLIPVRDFGEISGTPTDFNFPSDGAAVGFTALVSGGAGGSCAESGTGLYGGIFPAVAMPTFVQLADLPFYGKVAIDKQAISANQKWILFSVKPSIWGRADVRNMP